MTTIWPRLIGATCCLVGLSRLVIGAGIEFRASILPATNVTATATWEDWDLSSLVPPGTRGVLVEFHNPNGNQRWAGVRPTGSTDESLEGASNSNARWQKWVKVDADRKIQRYCDRTYCPFYVVAYSAYDTFFQERTNRVSGADNVFATIDVSGNNVPAGAEAAILDINRDYLVAVRHPASTDDLYKNVNNYAGQGFLVKLNASRQFQFKRSSINVGMLGLTGYFDRGCSLRTNAQNVSIGTTGSWTDIDLSPYIPAGATGVVLDLYNTGATSTNAWIRKKGSTDDFTADAVYLSGNRHVHIACGVDASGRIQGYRDSSDIQFWLLGYFHPVPTAVGTVFRFQ